MCGTARGPRRRTRSQNTAATQGQMDLWGRRANVAAPARGAPARARAGAGGGCGRRRLRRGSHSAGEAALPSRRPSNRGGPRRRGSPTGAGGRPLAVWPPPDASVTSPLPTREAARGEARARCHARAVHPPGRPAHRPTSALGGKGAGRVTAAAAVVRRASAGGGWPAGQGCLAARFAAPATAACAGTPRGGGTGVAVGRGRPWQRQKQRQRAFGDGTNGIDAAPPR